MPALGCRDRVLRVLSASSGSAGGREGGAAPLFEVPLPSAPTALLHVASSHDTRGRWAAATIGIRRVWHAPWCRMLRRVSRFCSTQPQAHEHAPACACYPPALPAPRAHARRFPAGSQELLVGCEDGSVAQLMIEPAAVRQGFVIPPQPGRGAVRALHCGADYSKVRAPLGQRTGRSTAGGAGMGLPCKGRYVC